MIITLAPQRLDVTLTVLVAGDALTINGEVFDFTPLPEGATLPADAVDSIYIVGPVERISGEITLTLLLPYAATPNHVETPAPIHVTGDGPITLPGVEV